MKKDYLIWASIVGLFFAIFIDYYLGFNMIILNSIILITIYRKHKEEGNQLSKRFIFSSIYIMGQSINFIITTNPMFQSLGLLSILVIQFTLAFSHTSFLFEEDLFKALKVVETTLNNLLPYFKDLSAGFLKDSKSKQIALGLIILLPLLLISISILSSADQIFSDMFEEIEKVLEKFIKLDKIIIFLIISPLFYAYLSSIKKELKVTNKKMTKLKNGQIITDIVLGGLNVVYLLFVYVQLVYLFNPLSTLTPLEYSTYAREGFYELFSMVMIITGLAFIIQHFVETRKSNKINMMITLGSTYVMAISAFYKMFRYEQALGYTRARLMVYFLLVLLTVLITLLHIKNWKESFKALEYTIIFTFTSYFLISYVNWDSIIAQNNIDLYKQTGIIDYWYLGTLSPDAYPVVIDFLEDDSYEEKFERTETLNRVKGDLNYSRRNWFEYNYRFNKAINASKTRD
jgi:hypothetical protein